MPLKVEKMAQSQEHHISGRYGQVSPCCPKCVCLGKTSFYTQHARDASNFHSVTLFVEVFIETACWN